MCVALVVCMLAPSLAPAQQPPTPPSASPPAPRPPGAFAPFTPSRPDIGYYFAGVPGRSIAGPDYRLGPGDVLDVQIVGRLEITRQQVIVDPEGRLTVPPLSAIPVAGDTLLEANRKVAALAQALFRFAQVTLVVIAPRSFEIIISGEVERPGAVQVFATQRLHEVVLTAGGVTPRGSVRRVQVARDGATSEVDLLRFELQGDLTQNPLVEERMTVVVPARTATVALSGAVRRPGEYELDDRRSLRDVLALTGGLAEPGGGAEARLTRIGPDGRKETVSLDLRTALAGPADVTLRPGDILYVPPLSVIQDVVEVRGAFTGTAESSKTMTAGKPTIVQRLELAQGERVRDVVIRAGGAAAFADLRASYVERAGPTGPSQRVPIDMHRLLVDKDETYNILLQNGDVVVLPIVEDKVYVVGEVKAPGAIDYRPNLTPREYLALAGGPTTRAKPRETRITLRNGRTYAMADAPPLEPGAVVTVPEVAVKWWQDYLQIAGVIAGLITAYTGIFILFNGPVTD